MLYRALVVFVVVMHFAFLGYVIAGGFLAYRWPRAIWPHLAAVAWAVMIVARPLVVCPLTMAENWARKRAGMSSYTTGFIDRYVKGVFYPVRYEHETQALVLLIVVGSWIVAYVHRRAVRRQTQTQAQTSGSGTLPDSDIRQRTSPDSDIRPLDMT